MSQGRANWKSKTAAGNSARGRTWSHRGWMGLYEYTLSSADANKNSPDFWERYLYMQLYDVAVGEDVIALDRLTIEDGRSPDPRKLEGLGKVAMDETR